MTTTSTSTARKSTKPAARAAARKSTKKVSSKRPPAKELMANRKRMFFGASYINGVLGGVHRDFDKMVAHANHLGLGSPSQLKKLSLETLREKLTTAITSKTDGAQPFSIRLTH